MADLRKMGYPGVCSIETSRVWEEQAQGRVISIWKEVADPVPGHSQGSSLLPSQALHTQMLTAVQEISHLIEPLASAARAEASQLGHKVPRVTSGDSHGRAGKDSWPS